MKVPEFKVYVPIIFVFDIKIRAIWTIRIMLNQINSPQLRLIGKNVPVVTFLQSLQKVLSMQLKG